MLKSAAHLVAAMRTAPAADRSIETRDSLDCLEQELLEDGHMDAYLGAEGSIGVW